MSRGQEKTNGIYEMGAANDGRFSIPNRSSSGSYFRQPEIESAHKLAVAVPVLPNELKASAIRQVLRLLKTGFSSMGAI